MIFFTLLILIPLSYSISLKELLARFDFSSSSAQINATNYTDFMLDRNNNDVNDTLIFEITANNLKGSFIFVINLFDRNGVLTNEINKTLTAGKNKINLTFDSILLS